MTVKLSVYFRSLAPKLLSLNVELLATNKWEHCTCFHPLVFCRYFGVYLFIQLCWARLVTSKCFRYTVDIIVIFVHRCDASQLFKRSLIMSMQCSQVTGCQAKEYEINKFRNTMNHVVIKTLLVVSLWCLRSFQVLCILYYEWFNYVRILIQFSTLFVLFHVIFQACYLFWTGKL